MVYFLYNLLLLLASPFYIGRVLWKNRGGKERFGISIPTIKNKHIVWIHAVSVGEVIASKPLISLLKRELPNYNVVLSTVTKTGREMAEKLKDKPYHIFYFPFDFPFTVKTVLRKIQPSAIVLAETELWPNLIRYSQRLNIPVVMINGTISKSSFSGYSKIQRLFKQILNKISFFCMQTEEDKNKLLHLGVKQDKIKVTGNTKFDCYDFSSGADVEQLKNWNIRGHSPVIAAGSTHPEEEGMILDIFRQIEKKFPEALLILVPRHPERVSEVENLIKEKGYSCIRRTNMGSSQVKEKIVLVDTIGELLNIYSTADIIFVGGSLVPIGGHNLLEPASLSKPIITGPYTFKQNEMVSLLKRGNGMIQVQNKKYLKDTILELLSSPEKMEELGRNAQKVISENQGATRKNLQVIEKILQEV
jgi:3-deoxy-D-manno-octulosonic-acid transferase